MSLHAQGQLEVEAHEAFSKPLRNSVLTCSGRGDFDRLVKKCTKVVILETFMGKLCQRRNESR